jgi:DNA-binding SARP family transcriptional activator/tetratricopeptide (TPR) repeat protein
MSGGLTISLLGEQMIGASAGAVRVRSARTLGLVAFLVVHVGAPQSRHRLAATFWPDSTEEQALTNLRRELHHLRTVLGDAPSLVVTSRDLCWRDAPGCRVDVRRFETERAAALAASARGDVAAVLAHAAAAVGEYRGEFLPGSYEDWALEARGELEQGCVGLLDLLLETRAAAGDLAGAVAAARQRIGLRPLEETGYRRLMELLGDLGDRAGAVSTYHHCASVLERELGMAPDPATQEALSRLLARTGPTRAAPRPPQPSLPGARTGRAPSGLVGRAAETGRLRRAWSAAVGGRPGLVLVSGDAGVGKSRLVRALAEEVRGDAVVATSQCFGASGRLALAPVADWLRTPAVRAARDRLDPVWHAEVDRLVPASRERPDPDPTARAMIDAWQRHRFLEGLARALLAVDRPLLLVVDNLQWCDQETLAFVSFCLGLAADAPLLVVATLRRDPPDAALGEWVAGVRATAPVTDVELGPLDERGTAELAAAVTGRPLTGEEADMLHATTGGFPLSVVEAARTAMDAGSDTVLAGDLGTVLARRLEQVGDAAREVAGLAAAVGRDFGLDLLTEAADLDADSVVLAVDELWRRRILREVGTGYDFSHDLLRDAAYDQVSPPRRWLLHRRVAQALELVHADAPDSVAALLAEQYARGGEGRRAIRHYRRAAATAAGMFAYDESIRLHRAALSIVGTLQAGRERDAEELAVLESMAAPLNARHGYSSGRLRHALERSVRLAEGLGRRDSTLSALVSLWASVFVQGDFAAAQQVAARALSLVGDRSADPAADPRPDLRAPAHFAFGGSAVTGGRPAEALEHFAAVSAFGPSESLSVGTRPDVHGRAWSAHALWLLGRSDEALACAEEVVAIARHSDNPYDLAVALAYAGITHQLRSDRDRVVPAVRELRALCDRYGFAYYREWGLVLDGWSRAADSGADLVRRGVTALRTDGSLARMPYWLTLGAEVHARAGRAEEARAILDAALAAARARGELWWLPEVMRRRAAHDPAPAAIRRLQAAADLASSHGSVALLDRCAADLRELGVRPARDADSGASAPRTVAS